MTTSVINTISQITLSACLEEQPHTDADRRQLTGNKLRVGCRYGRCQSPLLDLTSGDYGGSSVVDGNSRHTIIFCVHRPMYIGGRARVPAEISLCGSEFV